MHPYVSMLSLFHAVHIECPDTVLIERYGGKLLEVLLYFTDLEQHTIIFSMFSSLPSCAAFTSAHPDVYHLVFNPPQSEEVASRLVEEPGGIQANLHSKLELYHRNCTSLLSCYNGVCKTFNADQPIEDLFSQGQ